MLALSRGLYYEDGILFAARDLQKSGDDRPYRTGLHCIPWTPTEEVNAELLSFLGGKAGKSQNKAA